MHTQTKRTLERIRQQKCVFWKQTLEEELDQHENRMRRSNMTLLSLPELSSYVVKLIEELDVGIFLFLFFFILPLFNQASQLRTNSYFQ